MRRTVIGTLATLALLTADAQAQLRPGMGIPGSQREPAIRFYGLGGYAQLDVEELNARLASLAEPYSPVSEDMVTFGAGVHGRIDRFLIGAEASVLGSIEDGEVADERRAKLSGFYGTMMAGLSLLQTDGIDFYPLVLLGGGGVALEVEERGDPSWDEVLADPGRTSILTTAALYVAGGVGLDYTFRGGFFLGVRGTYGWSPDTDSWSEESGSVLGGPEMNLTGPSVRLMAGFGGR